MFTIYQKLCFRQEKFTILEEFIRKKIDDFAESLPGIAITMSNVAEVSQNTC